MDYFRTRGFHQDRERFFEILTRTARALERIATALENQDRPEPVATEFPDRT